MKINIAGYNIDKSLIDKLDSIQATPEVISAAYARISRSTKDVTSLRKQALNEVEKARKSNSNIIFEMGHSSIAEHVVFNLDILDVSRYLTELIQKSRLASFTEKSQRYVTLTSAYTVPDELPRSLKSDYIDIMQDLFSKYDEMYQIAKKELERCNFTGSKRELEGKAKEDARYILPLATKSQMGLTINARSLERLLRRLDRCDFTEAKNLKNMIEKEVKNIAPSVIKYTSAENYEKKCSNLSLDVKRYNEFNWELTHHTDNPDLKILAYYIFEKSGNSLFEIEKYLLSQDKDKLKTMFNDIFANMKTYHLPIKAFEVAEFEFQFDISASCFAQLKRHRMATIIKADYCLDDGYVIPPQLKLLNQTDKFLTAYDKIAQLYPKLDACIAPYILTNAHKVRLVMKANLRELYHFSRLRSDSHAQWEIQDLSNFIISQIQEVAPLSASLMMGKDQFKMMTL